MVKIVVTFIIKFLSFKNLIRISSLYLTGLLFRFLLIKYCNIDVFHDYTSLYSNLYYLIMAMLSVLTIETLQFIPNWSDIFKWIKMFIEYYLKNKKIPMYSNSGSHEDVSSRGHKNICSMVYPGSSSSDSSASDSAEESEEDQLATKARKLQHKVRDLSLRNKILNDWEARNLANRLDNLFPTTQLDRDRWRWYLTYVIRYRYKYAIFFGSNNEFLDREITRNNGSMIRAVNKLDEYNQRIQNIISERQISETLSQENNNNNSSSSVSSNYSNNNNNNNKSN